MTDEKKSDSPKEDPDTPEARANLESLFPNIKTQGYKITSKRDATHNCIAYAAGDYGRKWAGRGLPKSMGYYWPPNAKHGSGMDELVYAFEAIGFVNCGPNASYEEGYEKIALYMDNGGGWSHAAILLPDGAWSSKIGDIEDIRHNSQHAFHGEFGYGPVFCYMKRRLEDNSDEGMQAYE